MSRRKRGEVWKIQFEGHDAEILNAYERRYGEITDQFMQWITDHIRDAALPCIVDDPEEWFKVLAPSKELCDGCEYKDGCEDSAIEGGDQG